MANDLNWVIMTGQITRVPKMSYTDDGTPKLTTMFNSHRRVYSERRKRHVSKRCIVRIWLFGRNAVEFYQYVKITHQLKIEGELTWLERRYSETKPPIWNYSVTVQSFYILDERKWRETVDGTAWTTWRELPAEDRAKGSSESGEVPGEEPAGEDSDGGEADEQVHGEVLRREDRSPGKYPQGDPETPEEVERRDLARAEGPHIPDDFES